MKHLPLIAPAPPRLSERRDDLRRLEASGVFSNNGPEVRAFERDAAATLFDGAGECLTVANATLGLMLAIRAAAGEQAAGRYALMPALTFAATAQAAHWAGLVPLVCDIDPDTWAADPAAEERLLRQHGDRVALLVPYATFGRAIDLERYAWLAQRHGVGVVVDAAASLGTYEAAGRHFGAGAPFAIVFSMHATKTFATAEGGLIHTADTALIARLRAMANFGFEAGRSATLPGLNAKLPELLALLARARLEDFTRVCARRETVIAAYREALPARFVRQASAPGRQAMQFMPVVLPAGADRDAVAAALAAAGIGSGRYFSPHLGEQPWMRATAMLTPTPVADDIAARLLSLPVTDAMTPADARHAACALDHACAPVRAAAAPRSDITETLVVGGGPAGTALLLAASKAGRLAEFARGLVLVERDDAIGDGRLGRYAITSDSSAATFLSAIIDNPEPALAALTDHPAARAVAGYHDALGVPLAQVGALLSVIGDTLAERIRAYGGTLLTGHEAVEAQRCGDLWRVTLRARDGGEQVRPTRNLVLAAGGHQPLERLAAATIAGAPLVALAGDRLLQSDAVLGAGGAAQVADLLAGRRAPRIAVIGGSTSALTTVAALLKAGLPLGAGAITLLHRRPLRPFYPSLDAAHAEGFTDFGPDDVCPVSGFVYRLAGFRLEARELVLRMLGVDGRAPDPRVALQRLGDDARDRAAIADADLVVAALGYRPRGLPLRNARGAPLALAADRGGTLVDRHCRVRDARGRPIAGVFGIGLAAGFVPWGELGGERSFVGQANGLWLWQNQVGAMIVDQVLGAHQAQAAA